MRTEWISVALPAYDKCLHDHVFILAVILSTKHLHSSLVSLLAVMGMPKYLNGRDPFWNPVTRKMSCSVFSLHPLSTIADLSKFTVSPVLAENDWKASIRSFTDFTSAAQKSMRSSVNIRWVRLSFLQLGWYLSEGLVHAIWRARERYSMVRTNKRGDKGSPYLSPRPPWKCPAVPPFRLIVKLTVVRHVVIH